MIGRIFTPSEGINYNFVTGMYAIATFILVVLVILDKVVQVSQVSGFYIIFMPFAPCLLWSCIVRARWLAERNATGDGEEPKKER
mmetsp:Transcript_29581/g.50964  ORF Transcript_29581/g.50964 Transcript_29581/m.50964 type:complete len:85 (-) Transcript_29581:2-256(-)